MSASVTHMRRRAEILADIKSVLQPWYDGEHISREQFIAVCKQSLDLVMSSPSLIAEADCAVLRPIVAAQIRALQDQHQPLDTTSGSNNAASRTFPRSTSASRASSLARSLSNNHHVDDLLSRYFVFGEEQPLEEQRVAEERWTSGGQVDEVHRASEASLLQSSCSQDHVDPESVVRRRQQRLEALRKAQAEKRQRDSAALAQGAALKQALMDVLVAHQEQQMTLLHRNLLAMEQRNVLVLDEHKERQLLHMDESAAWHLLTTVTWHDVIALGRQCERTTLALHETEERVNIHREGMQEWNRLLTEWQQLLQRQQEELEAARQASVLPPPPSSPRPAVQFDGEPHVEIASATVELSGPPRVNGGATPLSLAEQLVLMEHLQQTFDRLPSPQKASLRPRLQSLKRQLQSSAATPADKRPATVNASANHAISPVRSPNSATLSPAVATRGLQQPQQQLSRSPRTPLRQQWRDATGTPKKHTHPPLRRGVEQPSREAAVEYLRSILQDAYDAHELPRDAFVQIVKHVSRKLFSDDVSWVVEVEEQLGKERFSQLLRTKRVPVWKAYLALEVDRLIGTQDWSTLSAHVTTQPH